MRLALVLAWGLLAAGGAAKAQVSIRLGLPSVRIGVEIGGYPDLVAVPGYPVYYAPQLGSNLFFYDGLYWVYAQDQWYASSWYDGPWDLVAPESVPYFVLRVPVRYYRQPPAYFNGWGRDAPPHWGEHWGPDWDRRHGGWDRWNRASAPAPAPLPTYQRAYSGNRYPDASQQRSLRDSNYRYQPHEAVVKQQYARPAPPAAPAARIGHTERAPASMPPAARTGIAPPPSADRTSGAARPEGRSRGAAPATGARHAPAEQAPTPSEPHAASARTPAPANREPQRRPADEARNAPRPAAARPPENRATEPRAARPAQPAPQPPAQREAPAARRPEPAERPQAKAPEHGQKKEPERERDH